MIKPTVGRVVLYFPLPSERSLVSNQPFRADVCHVHSDTCVNLAVNNDRGGFFTRESVILAQDRPAQPGECYWMDYQKGQAAKRDEAVAPTPAVLSEPALAAAMATRTHPRVTDESIEATIVSQTYFVDETLTICVLKLRNGHKIVGTSACVDPRNFDAGIGRTYARKDAVRQVWPLEGYALAERLALDQNMA